MNAQHHEPSTQDETKPTPAFRPHPIFWVFIVAIVLAMTTLARVLQSHLVGDDLDWLIDALTVVAVFFACLPLARRFQS